jgi:hypothetical protein
MSDKPVDAQALKKKIINDLRNQSDYWNDRKDKHPYEQDPEYFFECKENGESFYYTISMVEGIACSGTVEQFKKDLAAALEKNNTPDIVRNHIGLV